MTAFILFICLLIVGVGLMLLDHSVDHKRWMREAIELNKKIYEHRRWRWLTGIGLFETAKFKETEK